MHAPLPRQLVAVLCLSTLASVARTQDEPADDPALIGHSQHGEAFDEGPRQKPWRMEGIGTTHFPITTTVPEVQEWFDQGNTLLHNFWYFEAERAFRWCLKLDPECAMAYWGLSRTVRAISGDERADPLLEEAIARKDTVTDRERRFIEAWETAVAPRRDGSYRPTREMANEALSRELEMLLLEYPDDLEAKAVFALTSLYHSTRLGNERILQEILAEEPLHPGAHHYRIHNWDGPEGAQALESCAIYGQLARNAGHANHMPGHIYSGIGMWHEAAIWMDSATRVEKAYMQQRMILPFNNWNYAHNRNYLAYTQEQLGLPSLSLQGARDLLAAPLDAKYNNPDEPGYSVFREGMGALLRNLVKFERWDDILEEGFIPWRERLDDKVWRSYVETLAHLGKDDVRAAETSLRELLSLAEEVEGEDGGRVGWYYEVMRREAEALVLLRDEEDFLEGLNLLHEAAEREHELKKEDNDPPDYPRALYNVVGELYLEHGSPALAVKSFEKVMELVKNDAFALSGLARAHHTLGQMDEAREAWARLQFVWSECESGLRWMDSARALGLEAQPVDRSAGPQRNYRTQTLATLGPNYWAPYPAPKLAAMDSTGQAVTLDDYRGRNVLLVFYLGEECPHCMDQLIALKGRSEEFGELETDILAISSDTPEDNAGSEQMGELGLRLLSDVDYENARRFMSYDDFEEMELHSTILIDRNGKLRWARSGGDPFMELDFLLDEIRRINEVEWVEEPTAGG